MNIEENEVTETNEETQVQDKSDSMSSRDALELAIKEKRRVGEEERSERKDEDTTPTRQEVKDAVDADIEPPSEFSAKGKKAWAEKNIRGIQEEYQRINTLGRQEVSRAQTSERKTLESVAHTRKLAQGVKDYLANRGEDDLPDEVKVAQAVQLVNQLKKGDKKEILKELIAIGVDLTEELKSAPAAEVDKNNPLQAKVDELIEDKRKREFHEVAGSFRQSFGELTALKTRTGENVFPDLLDHSEAGIEFAKELGSLTQDAKFRQGVLRRFPDANLTVFVREAYKFLGGKVSGEPVKVSTSNSTTNIDKSRRAAASAPQGSTQRSRNDSSTLIGKLDNRAALKKALEESREH